MEVLYEPCVGLDVHKKSVTVCIITPDSRDRRRKEHRSLSTTTRSLIEMLDCLTRQGCTHGVIESTGVYWKPVCYLLEDSCEVLLVNPQPIKAVPGRKNDISDAEWLADLLQHGLL